MRVDIIEYVTHFAEKKTRLEILKAFVMKPIRMQNVPINPIIKAKNTPVWVFVFYMYLVK